MTCLCFQKQEPGDRETAGNNLNKLNLVFLFVVHLFPMAMSGLDVGLLVISYKYSPTCRYVIIIYRKSVENLVL